jgi:hypothetical protein
LPTVPLRILLSIARAATPQIDSGYRQYGGGKPEEAVSDKPTGKTRQADRAGGDEHQPATTNDVGDKHAGNAISV